MEKNNRSADKEVPQFLPLGVLTEIRLHVNKLKPRGKIESSSRYVDLAKPQGEIMPASTVKSFAERSGKSIDEVEAVWDDAKKQADKSGKFPERNSGYWGYVTTVTEAKLGLKKKDEKK